ncbi:MAG: hypothetical protein AVDCRST_MAG28-1909, partial [uncultured Rubrobacteraceae bacterium]
GGRSLCFTGQGRASGGEDTARLPPGGGGTGGLRGPRRGRRTLRGLPGCGGATPNHPRLPCGRGRRV